MGAHGSHEGREIDVFVVFLVDGAERILDIGPMRR